MFFMGENFKENLSNICEIWKVDIKSVSFNLKKKRVILIGMCKIGNLILLQLFPLGRFPLERFY